MMGIVASLLTLLAAALYYLADREQRLLVQPLLPRQRVTSLMMLLTAAGLWIQAMGIAVGLMVGLWGLILSLILLPMLAGHLRDSFQKTGGRS